MRAVAATAFGGPEVLALEPRDEPRPGPGQVTIDTSYAGINFAEVMGRRGSLPNLTPPFVPGLEVSGFVRELGEGTEGFAVGDPVCALSVVGGYAEVTAAPATSTYALPAGDDATLRWGAALPTIAPTAWALVNRVARIRPGEEVLISAAAGGVGILLGQLARRAGAATVIGVAGTAEKREYAVAFGYDRVVAESELRQPGEFTGNSKGFGVVFDSVGGDFRGLGFDLLAPMGRLVIFGNASGVHRPLPDPELLRAGCKAAIGFSITALTRLDPALAREFAEEALALATDGKLRIDITRVYPMAEVAHAHAELEGRRTCGKTLLAINGPAESA